MNDFPRQKIQLPMKTVHQTIEGTLDEVVSVLRGLKPKGGTDLRIRISGYSVTYWGIREETDQEQEARLAREKKKSALKQAAADRARERRKKQYEKLREEFG